MIKSHDRSWISYLSYCLIALLFLLIFSPYHAIQRANLRVDDASYLSHGFTLGLDYDLHYKDNVSEWKTRNQKAAAHPIGPGVLAAPFISAFSLIDRLSANEVIQQHQKYQYSWSYFGFIIASSCFFLWGLFLFAKGLACLNLTISRLHLLFVSSSFGILFYVLFRPVMGHSFEFFTLGLCFWSSCHLLRGLNQSQKISKRMVFYCALGIILTLQIRPSDINVILLPFILFGFAYATRIQDPVASIKAHGWAIFGLLSMMVVCFLPFMYINLNLYEMIYPSSDAMYGVNVNPVPKIHSLQDVIDVITYLFKHIPQLMVIVFSSEFGLVFSSTILFFGCIFAVFYLLRQFKEKPWHVLATLGLMGAFLSLPLVITLYWQSLGDAYGYRFLYCYFPIAILGYAYWINSLNKTYVFFKSYPKKAQCLQALILLLCGYGILSNMLFGLNEDLLYRPGSPNSFGREGGGAVGYNFAVVESAIRPATWVNLVATRTPGFFAVKLMDVLSIHPENIRSKSLTEKLEKFKRQYEYPPLRVYVQVLFLCGFFMTGLIGFCRRDFL